MRVLSISTDRKLFEEDSAVLSRILEYAKRMDEFHIIVFTKKGFTSKSIGNLHIYPTNSFSRLAYVFDAVRIGKEIVNKNKFVAPDAVLSVQDPFETGWAGVRLKKIFNLPLQVQIHTNFFSKKFKNAFLNRIRVFLAKVVLPKADGVRVVSEEIKKQILEKYPQFKVPIDVLPVFVDIKKIMETIPKVNLTQQFPKFKFIILMASRLTPEKRIDIALKVFKNVLLLFPHTGLIIAGDGSERNNLKNRVKKHGLSKNVIFLGWQKDLISLYKTADMFLVTSEFEGYGMTLIEAAASGCPIVTTPVGLASTELFKSGENSYVCAKFDVGCISKDVINIISDNSKRELFKRRMQDSIRNMIMEKDEYADRYVGLLKELINK